MQVALSFSPNAGASVELAHTQKRFATTITLSSPPPKVISPWAMEIIGRIASSTRLSHGQKQDLVRLTALVDEFSSTPAKDFRNIAGLMSLMEATSDRSDYPAATVASVLEEYLEWREALRPSGGSTLTITTTEEIVSYTAQFIERGVLSPEALAGGLSISV